MCINCHHAGYIKNGDRRLLTGDTRQQRLHNLLCAPRVNASDQRHHDCGITDWYQRCGKLGQCGGLHCNHLFLHLNPFTLRSDSRSDIVKAPDPPDNSCSNALWTRISLENAVVGEIEDVETFGLGLSIEIAHLLEERCRIPQLLCAVP